MRTLHPNRCFGGQRRYRETVAATAAHPDPGVRVRPARLRRAGKHVCRHIVVQRLEDLVAFVAGDADSLAGVARKRQQVTVYGALCAAGRTAVNVAFRCFQNERHQLRVPVSDTVAINEAPRLRSDVGLSIDRRSERLATEPSAELGRDVNRLIEMRVDPKRRLESPQRRL